MWSSPANENSGSGHGRISSCFFFLFFVLLFFFANILYSLSEYTTSPLFEIYSISLLIFFPENWFLISFSFIALSSIDTRFLLNLLLKVLIKVNFSYYCSTLSKKKKSPSGQAWHGVLISSDTIEFTLTQNSTTFLKKYRSPVVIF